MSKFLSNRRMYGIWYHMVKRCRDPESNSWATHGARGISVAPEWLDFEAFKAWSWDNGYADDLTIDRIDNDGHYEPTNCRWTDWITQANNRRNNKRLTAFGETKTQVQWTRDPRCVVEEYTIKRRLDNGWDVEAALITPAKPYTRGDLLVGTRIGNLTVTGPSEPGPTAARYTPVVCDCGNEKQVQTSTLRTERITTCGCRAPELDLPEGTRVGQLVVLGPSVYERGKRRHPVRCDCGLELLAERRMLRSGRIQRCKRQLPDPDVGVRFNSLVVTGPTLPGKGRRVPVRCVCGAELAVGLSALINGGNKSCGCLRYDVRSKPITAFGETKFASAWADDPRCVVNLKTLRGRLAQDWDPVRALTTPLRTIPGKQPDHPVGGQIAWFTVTGPSVRVGNQRRVPVRCVCGTEKTVLFGNLGRCIFSCGCKRYVREDWISRRTDAERLAS